MIGTRSQQPPPAAEERFVLLLQPATGEDIEGDTTTTEPAAVVAISPKGACRGPRCRTCPSAGGDGSYFSICTRERGGAEERRGDLPAEGMSACTPDA